MKFKGFYITYIASLLVIFSSTIPIFGQSYQFSKYNVDQGLPQQYVYSINQDNKGFIWVGTGEGIAKFDGVDFTPYTEEEGLSENFISCSAQRQQNQIWLGHNRGSISRILNGEITSIVSDTLVNSKITSIIVDQDNYVWATSQNGYLIRISPKLEVFRFDLFYDKKNITAITGKIESNLLIGTNEGLFSYELNQKLEPVNKTAIEAFKTKSIQCITSSKSITNNFWVGTQSSGFYQLKYTQEAKYKARHYNDDSLLYSASVKHIEEDKFNNIWISTFDGLFKLIYNKEIDGISKSVLYNSKNGLGNFINKTLTDREGNTWIGMYGEGLAMLKDEIFTFYQHDFDKAPNDTRSFLITDSIRWYGMSNGLLRVSTKNKNEYKFYCKENGFKDVAVTQIIAKGEELFLSTDGEGLYRFNQTTEKFKKEYLITSYLANKINKFEGYKNDLWIATEGGLIKKNLLNDETQLFNTNNGLKHNSIHDVIVLKEQTVISSHSNHLTYIKKGEVTHQLISDEAQIMDVIAMTTDSEKNLWLATLGNGVYRQVKDSFIQINSASGLNSDYCYSIIADNNGGIWVGHRGALSRISVESNLVDVFSSKEGIIDDFNARATLKDKSGFIWFGTNKRTIKFNPEKFIKNTIPPIVSVKNIWISEKKTAVNPIIELPYKLYKIKVEFIGVSFKEPEGIKYQYFLEGYDLDWSESTFDNSVTYPRLNDGEYTFKVKACNTDGYCSEETLGFTIIIATPFWKTWWFISLMFLLVLVLIVYVIKKREANQKAIQKRLEDELDLRTTEVVKKSELLEEKNKNITDSINYALRIQKSILPSDELLKEHFPESFILYKPRDIVSGDFYWHQQIGNKFLVACADCTGHGVPGAFMSMISSTLLKEIAKQYRLTNPANFLTKLDELLNKTLVQSDEKRIHDGLDLSLCVFDLKTNELSFSGAYRPVIIYKDGILERFKTSSFSIGGNDFMEKEFKTTKIQLKPGDIVYLFSDGYPDQFGGIKGKKMYLKGFESVLKENLHLPMDVQRENLKDFLQDWKKGQKQVDDILVMGIKIS